MRLIKKSKHVNSKYFILLGLILLFGFRGQIDAQDFCFTDQYSKNAKYISQIENKNTNIPLNLRVYIHVIRNSAGLGGQSFQDVLDALAILSQDFLPHNIFFVWDCQIDYIDSDFWFAGPASNATGIFNVNKHLNGIDIYLFPATANSPGGRANGVGGSSEFWVSGTWPGGLKVAQSRIISHEMGHVLNLWHTHHGCESGGIWEATDGSNCATAGDLVCDTPADPHLAFNVHPITCVWTGTNSTFCTAPEPLSSYNPDTHLIMAYTEPRCMSYFSSGQRTRMRNSITTLPHLLATVTLNLPTNCSPVSCPSDLPLSGTESSTKVFEATNNINSTQSISSTADVDYKAGNLVVMSPGFVAEKGADFTASIGTTGCFNTTPNTPSKTIQDHNYASKFLSTQTKGEQFDSVLTATPNPFQSTTTLTINLASDSHVELTVFNSNGQIISQLMAGYLEKGKHTYTWTPEQFTSGIYFARLTNETSIQTIKLVAAR